MTMNRPLSQICLILAMLGATAPRKCGGNVFQRRATWGKAAEKWGIICRFDPSRDREPTLIKLRLMAVELVKKGN